MMNGGWARHVLHPTGISITSLPELLTSFCRSDREEKGVRSAILPRNQYNSYVHEFQIHIQSKGGKDVKSSLSVSTFANSATVRDDNNKLIPHTYLPTAAYRISMTDESLSQWDSLPYFFPGDTAPGEVIGERILSPIMTSHVPHSTLGITS